MNLFRQKRGMRIVFFLFPLLGPLTVSLWGFDIKDDRQVTSQKPVLISANRMTYSKLQQGLVLYKGKVKATHDQVVLTADEAQAISDNREASADGHVKVVDQSNGMVMTCGNLEYRDRMNIITAHDHPMLTAVDEDGRPMTIRSRQMELYSDKKEVVANEDVEIMSDQGTAQAGKATFASKEDKVILEEDPVLMSPQGMIRGRRMVMRLGEDRGILVDEMAEAEFSPEGRPLTKAGQGGNKSGLPGNSPKGGGPTSPPAQGNTGGPTAPTNPATPTGPPGPRGPTAPPGSGPPQYAPGMGPHH